MSLSDRDLLSQNASIFVSDLELRGVLPILVEKKTLSDEHLIEARKMRIIKLKM